MNVVIIGAGAIGKAMGRVLKEKRGIVVNFWDAFPGRVRGQRPLAEIIPKADAVLLCIPSWAVADAIRSLTHFLKKKTAVVSLSKGIGSGVGQTMDRLLSTVLPKNQPFALLFGSTLADELGRKDGGCAVAAGSRPATTVIQKIFSNTSLSIAVSDDLRGVALAGVLKNIYAIGMGATAALKVGNNLRGAYVARAHDEMGAIIKFLGGRRETASGPAGLGDLVTTGLSRVSKNWQTGYDLVKTGGCCRESEGSRAIGLISKLLGNKRRALPLFVSLERVMKGIASPCDIINGVCQCQ